jgi:hypothetical protein
MCCTFQVLGMFDKLTQASDSKNVIDPSAPPFFQSILHAWVFSSAPLSLPSPACIQDAMRKGDSSSEAHAYIDPFDKVLVAACCVRVWCFLFVCLRSLTLPDALSRQRPGDY